MLVRNILLGLSVLILTGCPSALSITPDDLATSFSGFALKTVSVSNSGTTTAPYTTTTADPYSVSAYAPGNVLISRASMDPSTGAFQLFIKDSQVPHDDATAFAGDTSNAFVQITFVVEHNTASGWQTISTLTPEFLTPTLYGVQQKVVFNLFIAGVFVHKDQVIGGKTYAHGTVVVFVESKTESYDTSSTTDAPAFTSDTFIPYDKTAIIWPGTDPTIFW